MTVIFQNVHENMRRTMKPSRWQIDICLSLIALGVGVWPMSARAEEESGTTAEMVLVPGGTNSGNDPDFGAYSLTVESFWMDKTEVTLAQWRQVYEWALAHGYEFEHEGSGKGEKHPVHTVNWYDCIKWCNARSEMEGRAPVYMDGGEVYRTGQVFPRMNLDRSGYRLPTNEEWEYAARGGLQGHRFPCWWPLENTITLGKANYSASPWYSYDATKEADYYEWYNGTASVRSFSANGYGLYDMAGNVSEWTGSTSGRYWSCRGGGWDNNAADCRCGLKYWVNPCKAKNDCGFRAVCRAGVTTKTPEAVSFAWLERYPEALAAHDGDYEAFAADTAANGWPVWACYVADLDPTDEASELRVGLEQDENRNWQPKIVSGESPDRRYTMEGASQMPMEDGEVQWGEVGPESRFFRARVEIPE